MDYYLSHFLNHFQFSIINFKPIDLKYVLAFMAKAEEYIRGEQYLFKNKVIGNEEIAGGKFLLQFEKQWLAYRHHRI